MVTITLALATVISFAVAALARAFFESAQPSGLTSGLGHVARVGWAELLILFASGAVCVGAGQGMYYVSIRRTGVAVSQTVPLAAPFLTGALSQLVLGHSMRPVQWLSGTVLLGGVAYLVLGLTTLRAPSRADAPPLAEGG
jgi:drug/metabolite transporter (DMT)-like permease